MWAKVSMNMSDVLSPHPLLAVRGSLSLSFIAVQAQLSPFTPPPLPLPQRKALSWTLGGKVVCTVHHLRQWPVYVLGENNKQNSKPKASADSSAEGV